MLRRSPKCAYNPFRCSASWQVLGLDGIHVEAIISHPLGEVTVRKVAKRAIAGGCIGFSLLGLTVWLAARPTIVQAGAPALVWAECQPEQVEILILGTFHFAQQQEIDILRPDGQEQLARLLTQLEKFAPDKIAVEYPYARNDDLNSEYRRYLEQPADSLTSRNEIAQIGFRLARRLGHDRVFGVDVPMNLWHDSIQVFDEQYPEARTRLRRKWNVQYPPSPEPETGVSLAEILRTLNKDLPPANSEMYARFLPLVEGDIYAGALKLRPWYDRNLRIVQNFFRVLEEDDDRLLLVIGAGHLRVLKQILELTPQFCPVDALPYISGQNGMRLPPRENLGSPGRA